MRKPIKVALITEDDPFHLAEALNYFLAQLPKEYDVKFAAVLKYVYTKRESLQTQIRPVEFIQVFGLLPSLRCLWRILTGRIKKSKKISQVLKNYAIPMKTGICDINSTEILQLLKQEEPDLLIAIGVNSIFKKHLLELPNMGCINVHTGIKPEHRGRASMFWALADGDEETGITVHYIDEHIDSGHVIKTNKYKIKERSFDLVSRDLRFLGVQTLLEGLHLLKEEQIPQSPTRPKQKTKTRPFPKREDLQLFIKRGNRIF
ncbi:MAG: hypothetical protein EPN84_07865 [Legionella sp.]|nr:MAG: hypothetical protein EPN84_07865 [Legionella sp.]